MYHTPPWPVKRYYSEFLSLSQVGVLQARLTGQGPAAYNATDSIRGLHVCADDQIDNLYASCARSDK